MITGHVFIATSLDGFVARQDHSLDWLNKQKTQGEDHGYEKFVAAMDGLIMGSGSFRTLLGFASWPYTKPVVVMSRTLTQVDIPEHLSGRVEITSLSPPDLMNSLKERGWTHAYVDGGKIVQSFLRAGLIADMTISVIPILIGTGVRLFGDIEQDIDLKLISSHTHGSGIVQIQYEPA